MAHRLYRLGELLFRNAKALRPVADFVILLEADAKPVL
jgi:hypothetical protein